MKILISGSSGFTGSVLRPVFSGAGHDVTPLVRTKGKPGKVFWNFQAGVVDRAVHLAGESIAEKRWMAAQTARIVVLMERSLLPRL